MEYKTGCLQPVFLCYTVLSLGNACTLFYTIFDGNDIVFEKQRLYLFERLREHHFASEFDTTKRNGRFIESTL
jgi:hypothetical protein